MLEKILESTLDCKMIKPINLKGNQSSIFIGGTDAEAKAPILWSPDAKSQLIRKDPDAGKDWKQEEKGMTEEEIWMASPILWTWVWTEQVLGDGEGQGSLACCSPWAHKESDTTELLNSNNNIYIYIYVTTLCVHVKSLQLCLIVPPYGL